MVISNSFQSVYQVHYGNNETYETVNYCNDYDDAYGLMFTIYQASQELITTSAGILRGYYIGDTLQ